MVRNWERERSAARKLSVAQLSFSLILRAASSLSPKLQKPKKIAPATKSQSYFEREFTLQHF